MAARLATLGRGTNQHVEISTPTQTQAASLLNVSRDTVIHSRKVQREATPEVIKAVDTGQMTITAARFFCTLEDKEGVKTVPTCLEKSGGHLREKMTATKTKMQASERDTTTSQSSYRYDHAVS